MQNSGNGKNTEHGLASKVLKRGNAWIEYRTMGSGPGVVLIPSLGRGAEDFDLLATDLARLGYRVVQPEPRGIGGSSALNKGDALNDMAADIAAIIETEQLAPAVLVGHAAGNWVARVLAHDRPDLTRAVALVAAIVTRTPSDDIRASISGSFDPSLSDAERLAHLERAYFAPGADARVWLDGWWPDVARLQREAARQTTDDNWKPVAHAHSTLYLGAANDIISPPPTLNELRSAIGPKASLKVIPQAGHALLPEQPQAVTDCLHEWMSELSPVEGDDTADD
ncbi:alpha/beta hydrolase [Nisaea sp.]|uniref:alpha/beta fold hydrolase n=1 Tax=Nisaea sp. TaxID=2024842 RepID=UPI00329963F7